MRKENLRKDIVSSKGYPKKVLFRFALKDGYLVLDTKNVYPGRGVYLLKDLKSIETVQKKNLLARYQKSPIEPKFYETLKGAL